jgi:hypothetical protein
MATTYFDLPGNGRAPIIQPKQPERRPIRHAGKFLIPNFTIDGTIDPIHPFDFPDVVDPASPISDAELRDIITNIHDTGRGATRTLGEDITGAVEGAAGGISQGIAEGIAVALLDPLQNNWVNIIAVIVGLMLILFTIASATKEVV